MCSNDHLRPVPVCVVPDEQHFPLRRRSVVRESSRRRVEICSAVVHVGLEIRPLSPFVPGVDEHKWLAEDRLSRGRLSERSDPALVHRGRGSVQGQALAWATRIVVPRWNRSSDERIRRGRLRERLANNVLVGDDVAAEAGIEDRQLRVDRGHVLHELVRRELERAVDSELARVRRPEGLRNEDQRLLIVA